MDLKVLGKSKNGNFFAHDYVAYPHPYCIGSKHLKYNDTGILNGNTIKQAEQKGASCYICSRLYKKQGIPILSCDEHQKAIVIKCNADPQVEENQ